ncbi:MAG: ribosome maturation factor RimM [Gammaproteobacteria bacterium]
MSDPLDEDFVCLGVVTGAIGVKGEVRVKTFTETPGGLVEYGALITRPDGRSVDVLSIRVVKDGAGVFLDGTTDRDAAEALKGTELGIIRDALGETDEEGSFFHVDLIGLLVQDEDGNPLGDVKSVHDFGGGDVLEIRLDGQEKTELVPFRTETVPTVNVEAGFLVLRETQWLETGKNREGEGE